MNPYALAAALIIGLCTGWQVQSWRWGAADAARLADGIEHANLARQRADTAALGHEAVKEQDREKFQVIYRDVDRIVEKPVYRDVCLDPDGLRALSRAIRGADAASEPAAAVPAADGAR